MSNKPTGGPAFPCKELIGYDLANDPVYETREGLSIRDYFAAKAMQAIISLSNTYEVDTVEGIDAIAANAFAIADAMLKERAEA